MQGDLINKKYVNTFIEFASEKYLDRFKKELTPYEVSIEDGTSVNKHN